jgi:hypothetical protein
MLRFSSLRTQFEARRPVSLCATNPTRYSRSCSPQPGSGLRAAWWLHCPVCEIRIEAEKKAVIAPVANARDAAASRDVNLRASCLPHLALVAASLGAGQAAQNLLCSHAQLLERTAEDLQRYALRHKALRRYLISEEERRASQLVLLLLTGHRSVNAPWRVTSIL